jgi:hypothetical protein
MEDWVERLHQWGMQQRRCFCTVQDPLVCEVAREKATSCNMHSNVLAIGGGNRWETNKNYQKKRLI